MKLLQIHIDNGGQYHWEGKRLVVIAVAVCSFEQYSSVPTHLRLQRYLSYQTHKEMTFLSYHDAAFFSMYVPRASMQYYSYNISISHYWLKELDMLHWHPMLRSLTFWVQWLT